MRIDDEEEWLPIEDFPNYEVSSWGRVQNMITGRFLHPSPDGGGYYHKSIMRVLNNPNRAAKGYHFESIDVEVVPNDR